MIEKAKNYKYCVFYHSPSRNFFESETMYSTISSDPTVSWQYVQKVFESDELKDIKKFMAFVKLFGYA